MTKKSAFGLALTILGLLFACGDDGGSDGTPAVTDDAGPGRKCVGPNDASPADFRFPAGNEAGHADPLGAKAAAQARAGKITAPTQIVQNENARQKVRLGDYVIANDKIAAYIEGTGASDGYNPYGGEVLQIETVGEDGKPRGLSQYGESLVMFSKQVLAPDSVTVLADGSDGKDAIIRATGVMKPLPFLEGFAAIFSEEFNLPIAVDYVLSPGAEKLGVRISVHNTRANDLNFGVDQVLGFFHLFRSQAYIEGSGFGPVKGSAQMPYLAYDAKSWSFALRMAKGPIEFAAEISGFQYTRVKETTTVPSCADITVDYLDLIPAAGGIDTLRDTIHRIDGDAGYRAVTGKVTEAEVGVAGAEVHAALDDGTYLTRTYTGADGSFTLSVPKGKTTKLQAVKQGYVLPAAVSVTDADTAPKLTLPKHSTIHVVAKEEGSDAALPVRVQVIPETAIAAPPASYGVLGETNGRLYQDFAITGEATLVVPPGKHRVIVSHGYEYELSDTTVDVAEGATSEVAITLKHSVDSANTQCADFHIHSFYSVDAEDSVDHKVRGSLADGLEIPVSSEHDWIVDFQPVIQKLGMTKWAFGFPSEELTSWTYGHFGIVPLTPRPDDQNNGAVSWVDRNPVQLFDAVLAVKQATPPIIIANHPSKGDFGSYFSSTGFDRATGKGRDGYYSDKFAAVEVFNDANFDDNRAKSATDKNGSVDDWFALLDHGKNAWAVGNSDSHTLRTHPVGYPRTCIFLGTDDPSALSEGKVVSALTSGNVTVSGGLYITATGPGGAAPGGKATGPGDYDVVVQGPSWVKAKELEAYVDGVLVSTTPLVKKDGVTPQNRYEAKVPIAASLSRASHWVVFHARGDGDLAPLHPGRKAFAVTNPIFF